MTDEMRLNINNIAFKKVIAKNANIEAIMDDLYEMADYCYDFDRNVLIDVFDGDDESAYEYELLASDLNYEIDKLWEMIEDYNISDDFDDFFVAVRPKKSEDGVLGYVEEEGDYYGLSDYTSGFYSEEYKKRLMRKKKEEIIDRTGICLDFLLKYLDLTHKYLNFKAVMDTLIGENKRYLLIINQIEKAYEKAEKDKFDEWSKSTKHFDSLIQKLPEEIWATS